jgi:extracellular factor (EF) 3-hydroxypalmitic acid methyl ester biosynthesis protein
MRSCSKFIILTVFCSCPRCCAISSNLLNTGILLVCEATLNDSWLDIDLFSPSNQRSRLQSEFRSFIKEWEKIRDVRPEFKVLVADMQTLLFDLRRWLEQVELSVRSEPAGNRSETEKEIVRDLEAPILPLVLSWFSRFDEVAASVDEESRPAHWAYARRHLHPLLLCSPFVYRTFQKPLGYAGDYEMVNMILRDPHEGASLFAKLVNSCFLQNPPAQAHRNRIRYLIDKLEVETARLAAQGRRARILNLGCGPAKEIQEFLKEKAVCDHADFTLLDFNDETLVHVERTLLELKANFGRATNFSTLKRSVHQILKEMARPSPELAFGSYDFVYCAGLFDYMTDRICKRLMNYFYDLLAPGGLLLVTNVDASKPFRHSMEYLLEWHLICRNGKQLGSLAPDRPGMVSKTVETDDTGVNVFVEIRKP